MIIKRSIDIEDAVRTVLADYVTCYCRPLPKDFLIPSILITAVGGNSETNWASEQMIDTFDVVLDSRAMTENEALDLLLTAVGILKKAAQEQTTAINYAEMNTQSSWGTDPVRPDLAMCSARVRIKSRPETITL